MKTTRFKVLSFRSVVDSGWIPFSPDGITVLVGQNESGKSSILEALQFGLSNNDPTVDDLRVDSNMPEVLFDIELPEAGLDSSSSTFSKIHTETINRYIKTIGRKLELKIYWVRDGNKDGLLKRQGFSSDALVGFISEAMADEMLTRAADAPNEEADGANATHDVPVPFEKKVQDECADLAWEIWRETPNAVLFNSDSGLLPNQVDIDQKDQPAGPGEQAAKNYLSVAGIDLSKLIKLDRRSRESLLNRANSRLSADFNSFWSQTIGRVGRLTLKCDLDHYPASHEGSGKAHLVFWMNDGATQLYPRQRSQGVRWFLSFYLQLKASEIDGDRKLFLLDEPGANLHSRAQADVLRLLNQLAKEHAQLVYSTHSPQMIEHAKLYRVHAVQRDGDSDESPTIVIDAHRLGSAALDTLSPILLAMGSDLSQHQVIKKNNNVLLEELSGFYYMESFWKLLGIEREVYFIAATGVNKLEVLANMFLGWGLEFVVAVDDDKQGRGVYNNILKCMFGDNKEDADKVLLKIPGFEAIEDVFSPRDFAKFVLNDDLAAIEGTNGGYMKEAQRSKPVAAYGFAMKVSQGSLLVEHFEQETKDNIRKIVDQIIARLH